MAETTALLFASYGTTHADARAVSIDVIAEGLSAAFPELAFAQAYTSPKVRRTLERRGTPFDSVAEALGRLADAGVRRVAIQPGHLVSGRSFGLVGKGADEVSDRFEAISVGEPLISSSADERTVARALSARHPRAEGQAVVLMGHGTDTASNAAYDGVQSALLELGRDDVVVGAFGVAPGIEGVLERLAPLGVSRVALVPLMLSAGSHASDEMVGERPDSWHNVLGAAGYEVEPRMEGLGALPEVRDLYVSHARAALEAL